MRPLTLLAVSLFLVACGPGPTVIPAVVDEAGTDTGTSPTFQFSDAQSDVKPVEAGTCDPPDMLVILDRSESMSALVGTQGSRIDLAISAINQITLPPTDSALRFGLQVLPQIGGTTCSTQLVVPMGLATSSAIDHALQSMSPQLNYGTPIGGALASAVSVFQKTKVGTRKQYVLLLTDGGECCSCNTNDYDIGVTQQLYQDGIQTFVVGFGGDDDPVLLNDLACAGHTATNFATSCTCTSAGCRASTSINATTTPLYFKAGDGAALKKSLASIANQTCCGCNVSPN